MKKINRCLVVFWETSLLDFANVCEECGKMLEQEGKLLKRLEEEGDECEFCPPPEPAPEPTEEENGEVPF